MSVQVMTNYLLPRLPLIKLPREGEGKVGLNLKEMKLYRVIVLVH